MNDLEIHGIAVGVILTTAVHVGQWIARHGGIKGICLALWRGEQKQEQPKTP